MSDQDSGRDISEFANAGAQPMQPVRPGPGHALVRPTTGVAERIIGAQPVAVHRDEEKIFQKLSIIAARSGSDWFYRWPTKNRDGTKGWVSGPSIKLANDLARIFGNCAIEIREVDVGDAWVFYSRFTDIETGFSMERAYHQRKSQVSFKSKDAERLQDIAYQVGQSKSIRNVIVNALQLYSDFAFEEAQNSLIEKIGRDLEAWRKRTLEGIANMGIEPQRVERVIGRAAKDWTAQNISQIVAMMRAIHDGMSTISDSFPLPEQTQSAPAAGAPAQRAEGGGPVGGDDGGGSEQVRGSQAGPAPAAATTGAESAASSEEIATAYQRGKDAKAAGHQKRALPGEYRDADHTREALAWQAGFDGAAMPTFSEQQQ